jgi:PKD repeat protein
MSTSGELRRALTPSRRRRTRTRAKGRASRSVSAPSGDPGLNDDPWAVDVNWGDGSAHTTFNASSQGALAAQSHAYADNGSYTVTVKVTDKDRDSDSKTFTAAVANVAPTVTAASFAGAAASCGTNNATLTVSFTDPGPLGTWSAAIDWNNDGRSTRR